MHMTLHSNYTDLVDACRDAGLDVVEHNPDANWRHSTVLCGNWPVGSISHTCSMGKGVLQMDLFHNKLVHFTGIFESLETRGRGCL